VSLDAALLGLLRERPYTGYELKTRCFREAVRNLWTADQAQIYRTLERLKTSKLVTVERKRQSGKPDRKVYSLTDLGRMELRAWLASPAPLPAPREPFLLQLFFAEVLTDDELLGVLRAERAAHQTRLQQLEADVASLASPSDPAALERAAIDWLDDVIQSLEAGNLPQIAESGVASTC